MDSTYPHEAGGPCASPLPQIDDDSRGYVYHWCMSRTNIDLDDAACRAVMERYHLATKRDAVNLALRRLAAEPLNLEDARRLRGSGWEGDLGEIRASRAG